MLCKILISSIFFQLFFCTTHCQTTPLLRLQKSFGGSANEEAHSLHITRDGGFIIVGYSESNDGDVMGNHGYDYWVVKTDSLGVIQWQKCLGGTYTDEGSSVDTTSDGGYIVAGFTSSNNGDVSGLRGSADYWVVKLSSAGAIQWQKCLGGTGDDMATDVQQTTDGGYIVTGYTDSPAGSGDITSSKGAYDCWVVKLSSTGSIQWQKSLGGTGQDKASAIRQTFDGGYIMAGYSTSNNIDVSGHHGTAAYYDYWIVKLSSVGSIQWQKSLGGNDYDLAYSIEQTLDSGYVVAGYTASADGDVTLNRGYYDYWIVKLTSTGAIQWQQSLGGDDTDIAYSVKQTSDGGYIVAGTVQSGNGNVTGHFGYQDYWIVKLKNTGILEWQKCLGGSGFADVAFAIQQAANGEYIVVGRADSRDGNVTGFHGTTNNTDYWMVKLGADIRTYTFTGNGNWNTPSNWSDNSIPPSTVPSGSRIVIDPISTGECIINTVVTISAGASLTISPGARLRIPGNLVIQN